MDFTSQLNPHLEVHMPRFLGKKILEDGDTLGFSCSLHYHQKHLKTENCRFCEYSVLLRSGKSLLNGSKSVDVKNIDHNQMKEI